ncbi:MAG TPA: GNAT family N-acetyltransferase [Candidatus Limnocylindria bacterium]|nr:GNAT family N-acetyltransferase [Candidatus Limnocylindria bacterium]
MTDAGRSLAPVTVRDARPSDARAISRVARASWTDTYRGILEPAFIEEFLAANYAPEQLATAAERASQRDDTHFLVAVRDGEVVAYAHYGVGPRGPELFRIYADPAHYGTGAGSALLDEIERRIDADAYVLDVHARNQRGRAFYDRRGFVIVGQGSFLDGDLTLRRSLRPRRPALPARTERLTIRELTDADATALHRIYGDAEAMRHVGRTGQSTPDVVSTARVIGFARRHAEHHGFSLWAIDETDGEQVVGVAGLLWVEGHGPEVEAAYLVRRDRWGRGYATEALRETLRIGHDQLGLPRIVALAYPENHASQRVMEKAGMRAEGSVHAYERELTRHVSERPTG